MTGLLEWVGFFIGVAAGAVVLGFVRGFVGAAMRNRALEREHAELTERVKLARDLLDEAGPDLDLGFEGWSLYDDQGVNQAHRVLHGGEPPRYVRPPRPFDDDQPF